MTRTAALCSLVLLIVVGLAACGGTPPSSAGAVTGVSVEPNAVVLELGASTELVATVDGDAVAQTGVRWRSSNPTVATVNDSGRVTAAAGGSAVISATSAADPSVAGAATVRVPVIASVHIEPSGPLELSVGNQVQLAVDVAALGGASTAVLWDSSDDAVAAVAGDGMLTTKTLGLTRIRATSAEDGTKHADLHVTVLPGGASTLSSVVSADDAALPADGQATTTVWVSLRDGAGNRIESSAGVVTVAAPTSGILGPVVDLQDGTYRATYTSGTEPGEVRIEAYLNGQPLDSVATIELERVQGTTTWMRQFGTADDETVTGVDVNDDGTTAVVGHVGHRSLFVRVFDADGTLVWTRDEGAALYSDYATDVAIDRHGNVYVVGLAQGGWAGDREGHADAFVRKYGPSGVIRWTRLVTASWGSFYFNAVALTPEDDVVAAGRYSASSESGHKVHKFSAGGDPIWSSPVFGSVSYDEVHDIAVGSDGVVYVVGKTGGRYTASLPSLRTYSANGDLLSATTIDLPTNTHAYATGVAVTGSGTAARVFVVGQASSTGGNRPWVSEIGSWVWTAPEIGTVSGVAVRDDVLLVAADAARFAGHPAAGGTDAFLAAFSLAGELRSVRAFGSSANDVAAAIAVAANGVVVFAGSTEGTMTESPSAGGRDGFVARLFW